MGANDGDNWSGGGVISKQRADLSALIVDTCITILSSDGLEVQLL
jgi:hypothetical protein